MLWWDTADTIESVTQRATYEADGIPDMATGEPAELVGLQG